MIEIIGDGIWLCEDCGEGARDCKCPREAVSKDKIEEWTIGDDLAHIKFSPDDDRIKVLESRIQELEAEIVGLKREGEKET